MPFKSIAQYHWMFKNRPLMAKEWAAATPNVAELPERIKKDTALIIKENNHGRRKD